jgi:uncharacterized protein (TIGR02646 family)
MGVCVYCGRSLSPERHDSHIDHFRPRAKFNAENPPNLTLSYSNLVVSCGRNDFPLGHPQRQSATCGKAKGDWFDNDRHIDPTEDNCNLRFSYGMNGEIFPSISEDIAAETMIKVLNLNETVLSYERKLILLEIENEITNGVINPENMEDEIASFKIPTENGFVSNLSHVAARYIQDAF